MKVQFYDEVDDSLLKFAVIISKSNNKSCFQPVMDCIMVDDGK